MIVSTTFDKSRPDNLVLGYDGFEYLKLRSAALEKISVLRQEADRIDAQTKMGDAIYARLLKGDSMNAWSALTEPFRQLSIMLGVVKGE